MDLIMIDCVHLFILLTTYLIHVWWQYFYFSLIASPIIDSEILTITVFIGKSLGFQFKGFGLKIPKKLEEKSKIYEEVRGQM